MESEFLKSLVVIFGASALVVFLLHRLKMPSIVGFLIAGTIMGPHGIGLIKDAHSVELMAEIGVILLLFTIGIEFSMARLSRMKKAVIGGGGIQVLLTITLAGIAAYLATGHTNQSVFFGFLIALSSTAIVLKVLAEKGETYSPHGRIMVGILIFQDLCVVPLMLLIPALSGNGISIADVFIKIAKAALIIAAALLSARWIVPKLLRQVVRTRSRELFITTIILLCLGIALLTSRFGLSLALGANEVIPEEFETSVEIFSRVLHKYNFPSNVIMDMVDKVRSGSYTALRSMELPKRHLFERCEWLPEIEIEGFKVTENSQLIGKSIAELQIRKKPALQL